MFSQDDEEYNILVGGQDAPPVPEFVTNHVHAQPQEQEDQQQEEEEKQQEDQQQEDQQQEEEEKQQEDQQQEEEEKQQEQKQQEDQQQEEKQQEEELQADFDVVEFVPPQLAANALGVYVPAVEKRVPAFRQRQPPEQEEQEEQQQEQKEEIKENNISTPPLPAVGQQQQNAQNEAPPLLLGSSKMTQQVLAAVAARERAAAAAAAQRDAANERDASVAAVKKELLFGKTSAVGVIQVIETSNDDYWVGLLCTSGEASPSTSAVSSASNSAATSPVARRIAPGSNQQQQQQQELFASAFHLCYFRINAADPTFKALRVGTNVILTSTETELHYAKNKPQPKQLINLVGCTDFHGESHPNILSFESLLLTSTIIAEPGRFAAAPHNLRVQFYSAKTSSYKANNQPQGFSSTVRTDRNKQGIHVTTKGYTLLFRLNVDDALAAGLKRVADAMKIGEGEISSGFAQAGHFFVLSCFWPLEPDTPLLFSTNFPTIFNWQSVEVGTPFVFNNLIIALHRAVDEHLGVPFFFNPGNLKMFPHRTLSTVTKL